MSSSSLGQADAVALFRQRYSAEPEVVASAPGRVNLIGEHTDYNGGEVLPIAIEARTWVAVGRASKSSSRAVSANEVGEGQWTAGSRLRAGHWWDYVHGVAEYLIDGGIAVPPARVAVSSEVPAGAGLSSSAALEVAAAAALSRLAGAPLQHLEAAQLAHRVETDFVGVACGIMDQYAVALGASKRAVHIWCDTAEYELVPMLHAVLIFDTAVPRQLRASAYNDRRRECELALDLLRRKASDLPNLAAATSAQLDEAKLPSPLDRRARHVVEENQRARDAVDSLHARGTIPGELMYESHESLRSLYECSTAELDWFVDRASRISGVVGARLTGAGWGGCAIAIGEENALRGAASELAADYASRFALAPRAWVTRAADGLRVERTRQ